jgi:predicted DNA-binding transcriptional regulator AlpA
MHQLPPTTAQTTQPIAAALIPDARLTLSTVRAITGEGRSTIYEKIKAGTFPPQVIQSRRFARWRAGDVMAYLRGEWVPKQEGAAA